MLSWYLFNVEEKEYATSRAATVSSGAGLLSRAPSQPALPPGGEGHGTPGENQEGLLGPVWVVGLGMSPTLP